MNISVLAKKTLTATDMQPENRRGFAWLPGFIAALEARGVKVGEISPQTLPPARLLWVTADAWGHVAEQAHQEGCRFAGVWAEDFVDTLTLTACLEKQGDYVLLRTSVLAGHPELPSQAPFYLAANRLERHTHDLFGVRFTDHTDRRRWLRHQAWPGNIYPLRKSFPAAGNPPPITPPDNNYPFISAHGSGVYEIPVGPVHAGIIEPGHFRFQAVGETVLNLEERLGYVHKGIEKIAEGRDSQGLARLAGRVSGDTTLAHTWAACMAMERAAGIEVPARALWLRAIFAERERIANHLWDIAAICNDVAFTFAYYQFGRLRELWLRDNLRWFGHRLLMDRITPGGVAVDLTAEAGVELRMAIRSLRAELDELTLILDENPSLEDRLVTTGVLPTEVAKALGTLGYVGRASGLSFDLRRDAPYSPYDKLEVHVPVFSEGDVAARLKVRAEEIRMSLHLLEQLLENLPEGDLGTSWQAPSNGAEGLGLVEGWRGEILCYVRFGPQNTISRFYPRDPSVFNWPALEKLIHDNIVPDFPVCNKSVNGSYSGHDL